MGVQGEGWGSPSPAPRKVKTGEAWDKGHGYGRPLNWWLNTNPTEPQQFGSAAARCSHRLLQCARHRNLHVLCAQLVVWVRLDAGQQLCGWERGQCGADQSDADAWLPQRRCSWGLAKLGKELN